MKRPQLLAVTLILLVVAAVGARMYLDSRSTAGRGPAGTLLPQDVMLIIDEGVRFSEVRDDKVSWTIESSRVSYYADDKRVSLDKPVVLIYPPEGGQIRVSGDKGDVYHNSGDMELTGSVTGVSDQGYTLETDWLNYSETERRISTQAPVAIKSEDVSMTGQGLIFDVDEQKLSIPQGVRIKAKGTSWSKG